MAKKSNVPDNIQKQFEKDDLFLRKIYKFHVTISIFRPVPGLI